MHHVIQLILDSAAETQIRSVWHAMADQGICPQVAGTEARPHVTVMSSTPFAMESLWEDLVSLARDIEPFEITFSHLGIFPGKEPVLFLGVTPTHALLALHQRLFDLISPGAQVFEFAKPGVFVFHATLGVVLRAADLTRAVELACGSTLPGKATVGGFDVVGCGGPVRLLESLAFGGM